MLPFDWQVTDSYFIVAHFHYVLIGAVVFPIFAGLYYWYPKIFGRMMSERLGKTSFWVMFIGFNIAFFPMHILGLLGMARRVYTYESGLGWDWLNLVASIGGFIFATGVLLTFVNLFVSRKHPRDAGPEPVGRRHARVGDRLADARVQLRRDPARREPASPLGPATVAAHRRRPVRTFGRTRTRDPDHWRPHRRARKRAARPVRDRAPRSGSHSGSRSCSSRSSSRPRSSQSSAWSSPASPSCAGRGGSARRVRRRLRDRPPSTLRSSRTAGAPSGGGA